jgi:Prealbumin-like fold domain
MRKCFLLFVTFVSFMMFSSHSSAGPPPPSGPSNSETGIEGTIALSPTHPGPIREGVPSSAPLANIDFVVTQDDRTVASFQTDEKGYFRVSLPPGHYVVATKEKKSGKVGRRGPFEVDVTSGQMTKVEWHCDTGMR